jgi:ADP-ribosylglycohydrolase
MNSSGARRGVWRAPRSATHWVVPPNSLLVNVYARKRDHLDAYDVADYLVPLMLNERVWIPELHRETIPLQRVFLAEKWLVTRLHHAHADPREAGVGNMVNCGAAMYMAPVGILNAANPARAYAEAIEPAAGPWQPWHVRSSMQTSASSKLTPTPQPS